MFKIDSISRIINIPFEPEKGKKSINIPRILVDTFKDFTRKKIPSGSRKYYSALFEQKKAHNIRDANKLNPDPKYPLYPIVSMEKKKSIPFQYSEKKMEAIFNKIQSMRMPGIEFKKNGSSIKKVDDGLCSAIALTTLRFILSEARIRPMSESLKVMAECLKNGAPQKIAIIQAVFNTIHVDPQSNGDIRHAKMQSLANVYDLKLDNQFSVINIDGLFLENLEKQIAQLNDGAYCLRMLWLEDNHKQESCGHSLVLVKERDEFHLLDSGKALYFLGSENVAVSLKKIISYWGSDEVRFYPVSL